MNTESIIYVNGVEFPQPAIDGFELTTRELLAYAERTPKTMRFGVLGEVWELKLTYPAALPQETITMMYNELKKFKVEVNFYNKFTGSRMTTTFYRGDMTLKHMIRGVMHPFEFTLIGTEVL